MVTKIVNEDLLNINGEKILKGEEVEVRDVWLNYSLNEIFVLVKNQHGIRIITNVFHLHDKEACANG